MEKIELPCCGIAGAKRIKELPHTYGFDFDLFQCGQCGRYWVYAWFGTGGWEEITVEDAEKMKTLGEDELRSFMKDWAQPFN